MKTTSEQRQAMIGRNYARDSTGYSATVYDIERSGNGFVVKYITPGSALLYEGLQRFLKRFPHEVSNEK